MSKNNNLTVRLVTIEDSFIGFKMVEISGIDSYATTMMHIETFKRNFEFHPYYNSPLYRMVNK